jgi:hypothetical protein
MGSRTERKSSSTGALDSLENVAQKQLYAVQSIDHGLNRSGHTALPLQQNPHLHWANTYSTHLQVASRPDVDANDDISASRSSLPHIYDDLPVPLPSNSRRPRSAGRDAEPLRVPSVSRKLGSEYSLSNLFGKAANANAGNSTPK